MTSPALTPDRPEYLDVAESDGLSGPPGLPVPANAFQHSCGAWWTGLGAAHCGGCHRTFTSVSAFVKHRPAKGAGCIDPASLGLVPADRKWPGWSLPGTWSPEDDAA